METTTLFVAPAIRKLNAPNPHACKGTDLASAEVNTLTIFYQQNSPPYRKKGLVTSMQQPCVRIPSIIQVLRQILGSGAFGVVSKAVDEEEPWQIYALKEVLCLNAFQFHNAVREVQILKQLSHESVISLIGVEHLHDVQGMHMLILTEFCVEGN